MSVGAMLEIRLCKGSAVQRGGHRTTTYEGGDYIRGAVPSTLSYPTPGLLMDIPQLYIEVGDYYYYYCLGKKCCVKYRGVQK